MVAYDIGPKTIELYKNEIAGAGEIFWNGPMGMYENAAFSNGTYKIAESIAHAKGHTSVGGGDTVATVNLFNLAKGFDYISTGGGASLELLEGKVLPGLAAINDK